MISVVLMTYNQKLSSVLLSIESVLRQKGCEFELVVADDGSREDHIPAIKSYLSQRGFSSFAFVKSSRNKGIVSNLLAGVQAASFPIIKPLSPGDLLYRPDTLSVIESFFNETGSDIGFGRLMGYSSENNRIRRFEYNAPTNPEIYSDPSAELPALAKSQLLDTDWIPGCSLFYRKDFISRYLIRLKDEFGVIYSEDLTCPLITMDDIRIRFLDQYILWYEIGTGISTAGSKASRKRMYRDHRSFFSGLVRQNPNNTLCKMALNAFKAREFIALHTPFYGLAQSIVRYRYAKTKGKSSHFDESAVAFFEECRNESFCFDRE